MFGTLVLGWAVSNGRTFTPNLVVVGGDMGGEMQDPQGSSSRPEGPRAGLWFLGSGQRGLAASVGNLEERGKLA